MHLMLENYPFCVLIQLPPGNYSKMETNHVYLVIRWKPNPEAPFLAHLGRYLNPLSVGVANAEFSPPSVFSDWLILLLLITKLQLTTLRASMSTFIIARSLSSMKNSKGTTGKYEYFQKMVYQSGSLRAIRYFFTIRQATILCSIPSKLISLVIKCTAKIL